MIGTLCICLLHLCLATSTVVADEATYILKSSSSQSQLSCGDQYRNPACVDNNLTFSYSVNNLSDYLINSETRLIFSPGNYSLESELVIESVYSFSMLAWPWTAPSSKVVIICNSSARFEFRNISTVTITGLEFVGCFQNLVASVGRFQLKDSGFFGQTIFNGTVLIIEDSVASLDRAFVSAIEKDQTSTAPQVPEDCYAGTIETRNAVIGVLLRRSNVRIIQSWFERNKVDLGAVIYDEYGSDIMISNTIFINNSATQYCNDYCCFAGGIVYVSKQHRSTVKIYHSKFEGNIGVAIMNHGDNTYTSTVSITHSEFIGNTVTVISSRTVFSYGGFISNSLVYLDAALVTVRLSKFINNMANFAVVHISHYYNTPENLTNNVFIDNSAAYEVFINPTCRSGFSLSLGSSRCIQCSEYWHRDLIGIMIAAFMAGIALVIFMLVLNMTVAVGTLNGILLYANIVAANADTYFWPFETPDFVTVFISWLNFDIGFDVCFLPPTIDEASTNYLSHIYKALIQLSFSGYIIFLVITVIAASECSSKVAKIIGKCNPVAVLATMILLSYAKLFNTILTSVSMLYSQPAFGSRNIDVTRYGNIFTAAVLTSDPKIKAIAYFLLLISILILLLCILYTALVFFWQWLLRYQNKAIFKWMRYQKLRHFLEPYHAPYTTKYRYWTGLLLCIRVFLYLISIFNFSLDPRVDLMAVIFIVGGLILLKGVTAERVYKNWPLDVVETAIYFNLVAFSALTWYNLDFGGNQVAVAYVSVMTIFILLLGITIFHILHYTRLYKYSFVEKAFKWLSHTLLETKPRRDSSQDTLEELDGYHLERSVADHQELPLTTTYSIVEISETQ